jgi:hypothetical protein
MSRESFTLGGRPFLPLLATVSCRREPWSVDRDVALGVSILFGNGDHPCLAPSPSDQPPVPSIHGLLHGRLWWLESLGADLGGLPELLSSDLDLSVSENQDWGGEGCRGHSLTRVYKSIKAQAASGPTIYEFPIMSRLGFDANCLTPQGVASVVWTAVTAGAKGLSFFTTNPGNGLDSAYGVKPDIELRTHTLSRQLATLSPALLAPTIPSRSAPSGVKVAAHRYGGTTYIFAINLTTHTTGATLTMPVAAKGSASVLWEGRTSTVVDGMLRDTFAPLAAHIYRLAR